MGLNIVDKLKTKARPLSGAGWWKESERHAQARKTGKAGGRYAKADATSSRKKSSGGLTGSSSSKPKHTHGYNQFCEACGKIIR